MNIQVYCRIKPSDGSIITLKDNSIFVNNESYNFDHVFPPQSSQEDVFEKVSPTISDFLKGYNCTLFVYGTTSSGKTHTISGSETDKGIIPRTIDKIFEHITSQNIIES